MANGGNESLTRLSAGELLRVAVGEEPKGLLAEAVDRVVAIADSHASNRARALERLLQEAPWPSD